MHQKPDQMEETRWEGQNFSEVVVPQEEEEVLLLPNDRAPTFQKIYYSI